MLGHTGNIGNIGNISRILPEYCQNTARILPEYCEYCQNIGNIARILPEYCEYCQSIIGNISRILGILSLKIMKDRFIKLLIWKKTVNIFIFSGILLERSDDLSTVLPERSADLHFRVRALRRSIPTS